MGSGRPRMSPGALGIILGVGLGVLVALFFTLQGGPLPILDYFLIFAPAVLLTAIAVPLLMGAVRSGKELAPKRLALAIVLGVGLGLLIDSVLALLLRVPIIYFVVFSLGLILILPVVGGIRISTRFVQRWSPPELGWPALLLLAVILWPAAIGLPFGARILQLRLTASSIVPVYPGAQRVGMRVSLGDNENSGDRVHLVFAASADVPEVVKFIRAQLTRRGWEEGPQHYVERQMDGTPYWFSDKTWGRTIHIKFDGSEPGGRLRFEVVYEPDGPLGL